VAHKTSPLLTHVNLFLTLTYLNFSVIILSLAKSYPKGVHLKIGKILRGALPRIVPIGALAFALFVLANGSDSHGSSTPTCSPYAATFDGAPMGTNIKAYAEWMVQDGHHVHNAVVFACSGRGVRASMVSVDYRFNPVTGRLTASWRANVPVRWLGISVFDRTPVNVQRFTPVGPDQTHFTLVIPRHARVWDVEIAGYAPSISRLQHVKTLSVVTPGPSKAVPGVTPPSLRPSYTANWTRGFFC